MKETESLIVGSLPLVGTANLINLAYKINLPKDHQHVLAYLCFLTDNNKLSFSASYDDIAGTTKVRRRKVIQIVSDLCATKLLTYERGGRGNPNSYKFDAMKFRVLAARKTVIAIEKGNHDGAYGVPP